MQIFSKEIIKIIQKKHTNANTNKSEKKKIAHYVDLALIQLMALSCKQYSEMIHKLNP